MSAVEKAEAGRMRFIVESQSWKMFWWGPRIGGLGAVTVALGAVCGTGSSAVFTDCYSSYFPPLAQHWP